jgi:hypothetical protein
LTTPIVGKHLKWRIISVNSWQASQLTDRRKWRRIVWTVFLPSRNSVKSVIQANMKEMYGGYSYASDEMANLIKCVEKAVQQSLHDCRVNKDSFVTALKYLRLTPGEMVGCVTNMEAVTNKIVFHLTMRMFFACDRKMRKLNRLIRQDP